MKNTLRPVERKGKLLDGKGNTCKILTWDIPKYFEYPYWYLIAFWNRWRKLGDPWNEGWSNWPYWAVQTIEAIEEMIEVCNGNS